MRTRKEAEALRFSIPGLPFLCLPAVSPVSREYARASALSLHGPLTIDPGECYLENRSSPPPLLPRSGHSCGIHTPCLPPTLRCARTPRCFETHSSLRSPPRRDRHSSRLTLFPALTRAASLSVTDVRSPGSRLGSPFLAAAAHRLAGRPVPLCAPAGRLSAHHESPSFIGTSSLRPISVPIPPSATRPPLLGVSVPSGFHSPPSNHRLTRPAAADPAQPGSGCVCQVDSGYSKPSRPPEGVSVPGISPLLAAGLISTNPSLLHPPKGSPPRTSSPLPPSVTVLPYSNTCWAL